MGLKLQESLSRHPFERTIDWRVKFGINDGQVGNLIAYLREDSRDGYVFARSVNITTHPYEVVRDTNIIGVFESRPVLPKLEIELFCDSEGVLETALTVWCSESYDNRTGAMGHSGYDTGTSDWFITPEQEIIIQRISPISMNSAIKGWASGYNLNISDDLRLNKLLEYHVKGYLSRVPEFSGNSQASVRTVRIEILPVEYGVGFKSVNTSSIDNEIARLTLDLEREQNNPFSSDTADLRRPITVNHAPGDPNTLYQIDPQTGAYLDGRVVGGNLASSGNVEYTRTSDGGWAPNSR